MFLDSDFSLTKRQLGWIILFIGLTTLVAALLYGNDGFGAAQKTGAAAAVLFIVIGLTLLPLGDQPA